MDHMKWLAVGLALGVVGAAIGWKRSDARATELRLTLEAAHARYVEDSTAWAGRERTRRARMDSLRRDSVRLAGSLAFATRQASASAAQLRALLAQVADSSGLAEGEAAIVSIIEAGEVCHAARLNAESRAATCEQGLADALARAAAADSLREETWSAWRDAERRAAPNLLHDFWKARALTVPLLGLVALSLVLK